MFWFPSQEQIGPWCGSFTKHILNFESKEEDNEMYIPSRNNIAPYKLKREVKYNLE